MEYKNYNEMLEKYGFDKIHTGGGCFYYERNGPPETNFVIVLFTNHRDNWILQEECEEYTHDEYMEHYGTEYDIWVCETEPLYRLVHFLEKGEKYIDTEELIWPTNLTEDDNLEWTAPQYRIKELNKGHELNNEHTLFEEHIQKTIALSESLTLDRSYLDKYGCTHQELLDKYHKLDLDEFKEFMAQRWTNSGGWPSY